MQTKYEPYEFPQTYAEAVSNLTNNFHSLGFEVEDRQDYGRCNTMLERIALDLETAKGIYSQLHVGKTIEPTAIAQFQRSITTLRAIIRDAITTLSDEELLNISFNTDRFHRINLLEFLAEIGEVSLFKAAFTKLQTRLTMENLTRLFQMLLVSYEGTRASEGLGLASSTLNRGNVCYPVMAEWMLNSLGAKGRELLQNVQENLNLDSATLIKSRKEDLARRDVGSESYKDSAWQGLRQGLALESDEARVKAAAEVRYHHFVTQPAQEHLFWKAVNNFSLSASPIYEKTTSDFLLKFLASKELKIAAFVIVFIGFVIGSFGVGAAIASVAAGTGIAVAGFASMGLGLGLCGAGFFASSRKDPLENFEREENNFYTGMEL